MRVVPNVFPTLDLPQRLAVIGEAPGVQEMEIGTPFVGPSGQLLNSALSKFGLARSACFLGNVCQVRPENNIIETFDWNGPEMTHGRAQLKSDLDEYNPNMCLLLGGTALKAAGIYEHKITTYRGSIFECREMDSPFFGRKCMASIHPAAILRAYSYHPYFVLDTRKAISQSSFPDLRLPERKLEVDLTAGQAYGKLCLIQPGDRISVDIEGGIINHKNGKPSNVSVIGIATSPYQGFTINLQQYSIDDQMYVMREFCRVMWDPSIEKILQNSLYDNFVLTWLWKCPIRGITHDTMLSGWERFPELEKGLDIQTSIYTNEPYYKHEGKVEDFRTHCIYCAKDATVTFEIADVHDRAFEKKPDSRAHFNLNMGLLAPVMYMELKGFRLDRDAQAAKVSETKHQLAELQARIDVLAGHPTNPESPKQLIELLYRQKGLPPQYKIEKGRKTTKLTCDKGALLNLMKLTSGDTLVYSIACFKKINELRGQLEVKPDADGRIRGSTNIVGTETGRFSAMKSPTGTGASLHTVTDDCRVIYIADPGYTIFQCDLAGADGWTVAAHCDKHGDQTMLNDYLIGNKPAKILAAMKAKGAEVSNLPPNELRAFVDTLDIPPWLYFACKRVQHGTNYGLGAITMSGQILKDSWDDLRIPVWFPPKECEALQRLYLHRYWGVKKWHEAAQAELMKTGEMKTPSGNTRQFFGRRTEHDTFREWLAHEPQINTTYATTLALKKLWEDPENRSPSGEPIIQPLDQVHDALVGQFPSELETWARAKIESYFDNTITIAGRQIRIPAETKFGPSWGEVK